MAATARPSTWLDELDAIQKRIDEFDDRPEDPAVDSDGGAAEFVQILRDACVVVCRAEDTSAPDLDAVVEKAYTLLNGAIFYAYGDADLFDFIPSFAHDPAASPMVEDTMEMSLGQGVMDSFLDFFKDLIAQAAKDRGRPPPIPGPGPWVKAAQPHPKTTRLSRFRPNITVSATTNTPLANVVYQARCEITDDDICQPGQIAISADSSCLALLAAGGWKNRDPVLHYYPFDNEPEADADADALSVTVDPGLSEVAHSLALDDARKLIFLGDSKRVKSFSWADTRRRRGGGTLVHTLRSSTHTGPLAVLSGGRLARAGRGSAAVWDIDVVERHRPGKHVGKGTVSTEDTWRDTEGDIELSTGVAPHRTAPFADSAFVPAEWHLHAATGHMLCGESGSQDNSYGCVALDLEHGGKVAMRFLGHGGDVEAFSTSAGDAHLFATAGSDGYARLFDVRRPLPVMTFDSGKRMEFCPGVLFVHPDGLPTLFTAGNTSEQIKLWDVRARAVVYELGTGNNSVVSMAWDAAHTTLYAATKCSYVDRMGRHHDYREARIPRWAQFDPEGKPEKEQDVVTDDEDENWEDEHDDAEEYAEDDNHCWPKRAFHGENFFGYAFDAGEHRLLRYTFKEDADTQQLPVYSEGSMQGMDSYW